MTASIDGFAERYWALDGLIERVAVSRERVPEVAYVHGLSESVYDAYHVLENVSRHYRNNEVRKILYNGSDGRGAGDRSFAGAAWNGAHWLRSRLIDLGVSEKALVPTGHSGIHTRAEADELVAQITDLSPRTLLVCTSKFHRVRSLSCLLGSLARWEAELEIWYLAVDTPKIDTIVVGSQGLAQHPLSTEIEDEISRCAQYWNRGAHTWRTEFGAPPDVIAEYLALRSTSSSLRL